MRDFIGWRIRRALVRFLHIDDLIDYRIRLATEHQNAVRRAYLLAAYGYKPKKDEEDKS